MRTKSYSEVESVISNINYSGAIEYYKALRNQLFNYLEQIAGKETATLFMDTLSEILAETLDQRINGKNFANDIIFKRLPEYLEQIIYKSLENSSNNEVIQQAKTDYLAIKNSNDNKGKAEANKILQSVVNELGQTNKLITFIKRQNTLAKNAVDFGDIRNQLPAFQRSVIKEFFETGMKGGGGKGGNLATVVGYYQESLIADAIYKYLIQLGVTSKDFTAKQVGAVKLDGKDTSYDVLFGAIFGKKASQLQADLQKMNGIIDINQSLNTFGIQSKRAKLPTRFVYKKDVGKQTNARFLKKFSGTSTAFKIGNRANLHDAYISSYGETKNYQWTTALEFLSRTENVKESLGPGNVMWVAGNEAMWTDTFISTFVNNRMRLNFEFLMKDNQRENHKTSYKAYRGTNLIVLAYHNANLRYALINS